MALDGYEIEAGRKLRVCTVPELLRERAEVKKSDRIGVGKKKEVPPQAAMPIRRPNQPGARRGGRGGLGVRRGGVGLSGARTKDDGVARQADRERGGAATAPGGKKSNADFKAMLPKVSEGNGEDKIK